MRFVRLLAAAAALAFSGQAQAAKVFEISGTLAPDENGTGTFGMPSVPFSAAQSPYTRAIHVSFSSPATGTLWFWPEGAYGYSSKDQPWQSANDLVESWSNFANARMTDLRYRSPVLNIGWGLLKSEHFSGSQIQVDVYDMSGPVNFTMTGFAAVPEPATWAMMILGFGAIGAALRGRARYSFAHDPAMPTTD